MAWTDTYGKGIATTLRQLGLNPKDYPDLQAGQEAIADFKRGKTPQELASIMQENQSRIDSAADENVAYPATTSEETQPASEGTEAGAKAAFAEGGMQGFLEYVEAHEQKPPPKTEEGAKAAYAEGGFQKFLEYADDGTGASGPDAVATKPTSQPGGGGAVLGPDDLPDGPFVVGPNDPYGRPPGSYTKSGDSIYDGTGQLVSQNPNPTQPPGDTTPPPGDGPPGGPGDGPPGGGGETEQQQYDSLVASGEIKAGDFQSFLDYSAPGGDDGTTTDDDGTTSQLTQAPGGDDGTTSQPNSQVLKTEQQQYDSLVASGEIKGGDFQSFLDYSAPGDGTTTSQPPPPGDGGTTSQPPPPGDGGTTSQPPPPGDGGTTSQPPPPGDGTTTTDGGGGGGGTTGVMKQADGTWINAEGTRVNEDGTTWTPPTEGDDTTTDDDPPVPGEDYGSIRPGEDRSVRKDSEAAYEQGGLDGFLKFAEDHVTSAPLFERKIQTGFEDLIANRVKDLEYDREAVVAEGVAEIDRSFQDAAQELARFANLSPGGPDSGQVIDKMERLLLSRETSKLELKQRAREKEFEAADKAIARMTETANTFFGQDVTRAGMTGEFRGETTVQEEQRKIDNENAVTEMYGGKPPTIMTVDQLKNSMNSVEGDDEYNPAFDIDKDGEIGFNDWLEVTQNGVMMDDGRIAYGAGPRTVAGQQMDMRATEFAETHGLDKEKFTEAKTQFDEKLQQDMDQFRSSSVGQMMHTDENGNLVMDKDPNTGLPFTTMQKLEFDQDLKEFNQNFNENVRQFGIQAGFKEKELNNMKNRNWAGLVGGAFSSWMKYESTKN